MFNTKEVRKQRRLEAEKRQEEYDALSLSAKIKRAKSRPGNSTKELAKLNALKKESKKKK